MVLARFVDTARAVIDFRCFRGIDAIQPDPELGLVWRCNMNSVTIRYFSDGPCDGPDWTTAKGRKC